MMDQNQLLDLMKKVEKGEASEEERLLVLQELDVASEEYLQLLKFQIENLKIQS